MTQTDPTPPVVAQLAQRFAEHRDAYRQGQYNETQLRREFLDPLFKALGWDVDNEQGYAEAYKDVIHEDAIKVGGATKAPDYGFRIGGVRKFFLEAKKPSVDIKGDPGPAYQLRRYAWSAKLPLSILSDFEEFAVYDCRVKPAKTDKASVGRVMYFTCDQLADHWHEFAGIFSRDAILKGSFDKYADSSKRKRGTAEVDDAFLEEIEHWRDSLARNLAIRNENLSQRDLNFAVQRTIDRLIFLRICEDRAVEPYGTLQALLNGDHVYERLFERFRRADERYNSGLFHFAKEKGRPEAPDDLTPGLAIDDKTLKDILARLYYPDSPYEFSVLPADILGQVYEQFLGKVIRLTKGHRAVVEEKPEVRKAGGVYYTPTYIVDYIVKHTVGKLVEGKTPKEVGGLTDTYQVSKAKSARPVTVLDPACGSGSFLLGAYQFLLDWYRDCYISDGPEHHTTGKNPRLYQHASGEYKLTTAERKRILLSHIYGVDIDAQAVETTKLSLLLKVLEGESAESIGANFRLFHERALPDLADNIKCGNSLIGPDFYDQQQANMFDEEERLRINVFDWKAEFPHIFPKAPGPAGGSDEQSGFDAVIGNPPYVRIQTTVGADTDYLRTHFASALGNFDIYCLFIEQGAKLIADHGKLSLIVPHRFCKTNYGEGLRILLSDQFIPNRIVDFDGFMVFDNASINTCVIVLDKSRPTKLRYSRVCLHSAAITDVQDALREDLPSELYEVGDVDTNLLSKEPWIFVKKNEETLWDRLQAIQTKLPDVTMEIFQGLKTGADSVFVGKCLPSEKPNTKRFLSQVDDCEYELEGDIIYPLAKGGQIGRYSLRPPANWIIHPYENGELIRWHDLKLRFPKIADYLSHHRTILEARDRGSMKGPTWYGYSRNQALRLVRNPKILVPDYYANASYCLDGEGQFMFCGGGAGGYGILTREGFSPYYLLGCLNSRTVDWYLRKSSMRAYQTAYMYTKKYLVNLPIIELDCNISQNKLSHDSMVALVQSMLDLHKQLAGAKTSHAKTAIQRQIDATDRQIDQLVYELYGLTDEEIRIVEEATR